VNASPDPSAHRSLRAEFAERIAIIRDLQAGKVSESVKNAIHSVAENPAISQEVIDQIEAQLPTMRKRFVGINRTASIIFTLPLLISYLLWFTFGKPYYVWFNHELVFWIAPTLMALYYFARSYFDWRSINARTYIADYLMNAVEDGLRYSEDIADTELRDKFAISIQRAAIRYASVFKSTSSTRFFAAQVRSKAKSCRNDILSIIPSLVAPDPQEIKHIADDFARLIIRTQTGYWYQTSDIAKGRPPLRRGEAIRIALISFVADRSIQVALIALTATAVGATLASIMQVT